MHTPSEAVLQCESLLRTMMEDLEAKRIWPNVRSVIAGMLKRRIERRYLLTRYDRRRKMSQEIQQTLRGRYAQEVCETVIIENVAIAESPAHNRDVFSHAESSVGAKNYTALFYELQRNRFI